MELRLRTYRRPMRWGELHVRKGLVITMIDADGILAQGEAAPLPGWSTETYADTCIEMARLLSTDLPARVESIDDVRSLIMAHPLGPAARHGLEQALLTLVAVRMGRTLPTLLTDNPTPPTVHRVVRSISAAKQAIAAGIDTLKLKLGGLDLKTCHTFLTQIRLAVGPHITLRADANTAWSAQTAPQFLALLSEAGVVSVEAPVPGGAIPLAALRGISSVAIIADESCRTAPDLASLIRTNAVDAVVLKPMLIGGLLDTLAMARRAQAAEIAVQITTTLETHLGCAGAAAVAQACPATHRWSCGIDPFAASCGPLPAPAIERVSVPLVNVTSHSQVVADVDHQLDWTQIKEQAALIAGGLSAMGVRPGDRVALPVNLSVDSLIHIHGIWWLGAILIPEPMQTPDRSTLRQVTRPGWVFDGPLPIGDPCEAHHWGLNNPVAILCTSGTSGPPRPIEILARQFFFSAAGSAWRLGHGPHSSWLCALPLHHIGGLSVIVRATLSGSHLKLAQFDPNTIADALVMGTVTHLSMVPTMLRATLDVLSERTIHPHVKAILIGGAALPEPLRLRAISAGLPITPTWGMTETSSQVATALPGQAQMTPLATARVGLIDDCLTVEGPLTAHGWLKTGDRGEIRQDGIYPMGRVDGVIISGGENITPERIEAVLCTHPAVADAVVFGRADPRWGARPHAVLIPQNASVSDITLRTYLAQHLPKFMIPDTFRWSADFPRTALGKPARALLRAETSNS